MSGKVKRFMVEWGVGERTSKDWQGLVMDVANLAPKGYVLFNSLALVLFQLMAIKYFPKNPLICGQFQFVRFFSPNPLNHNQELHPSSAHPISLP